jgi:hypothetical protein
MAARLVMQLAIANQELRPRSTTATLARLIAAIPFLAFNIRPSRMAALAPTATLAHKQTLATPVRARVALRSRVTRRTLAKILRAIRAPARAAKR